MPAVRADQPVPGSRRRPVLLVAVFGVFLLLVGLTATGLVVITTARMSSTTLNTAVTRDAALVELFVNLTPLRVDDLSEAGPDASRTADVDRALKALTARDAILRVDIRDRSG